MSLHLEEFTIDGDLVLRLISDQMPQWSGESLRPLETSGTVNITFRLGDDKIVRLPRSADFADGPLRESRWMPILAPRVPLTVPAHLALGTPSAEYPSHWSVLEWIDGEAVSLSRLSDPDEAASMLGEFVVAMKGVPTNGAPHGTNYRALGLHRADSTFRRWADQLPDDIERGPLMAIWDQCRSVGEWQGPPKWMHSDLRGDNLIARKGKLVAVIDWEGCTVGDPSADYLAAWWLFHGNSRETFRTASSASRTGWLIGKGWALFMAVAAIPYYSVTNPAFERQARAALGRIIADDL